MTIVVDGRVLRPTRAQVRGLLALLVLNANQLLSVEVVEDSLWGGVPPRSARAQLQSGIHAIRRELAAIGATDLLVSRGGYKLVVQPDQADLTQFDRLVQQARGTQQHESAIVLFRKGLDLWQGAPLADAAGAFVESARARLTERFLLATENLVDLELAAGEHGALVANLRSLVDTYPMREGLRSRLMVALHRSGQQADALAVFRDYRSRLADEQGLDPTPSLVALQAAILRRDPSLELAEPSPADSAAQVVDSTIRPLPAHLPARVRAFTGRTTAIAALDVLLKTNADDGPLVVAISGIGGVGKTALAVHWAHRVRHHFPGGQLFVDLRGFATEAPLHPLEALSRLLRALGVAADEIPADAADAAAHFRSHMADRRALVLLDNAYDAEQVRPLLPGGSGCTVLVTSRQRLDGLIATEGARHLPLYRLTADNSLNLLRTLVGSRIDQEAAAAREVATLCGHLPLALRIAAAHLTAEPDGRVSDLAANLRSDDRLSALTIEGDKRGTVRGAFALSYESLTPSCRRLFRLLGLVPGEMVTLPAAAALAGEETEAVAALLVRLTSAHLVEQPTRGRFEIHDLTRLYATERVELEHDPADRRSALVRLYGHWLQIVDSAGAVLYPQILRLYGNTFAQRTDLPSADTAVTTLDDVVPGLEVAARQASVAGLPEYAWRFADALRGYFLLGRHAAHWAGLARAGLAAAEGAGNVRAQAVCLLSLGYEASIRYDAASVSYFERAQSLSAADGWPECEASALNGLAQAHWVVGELERAAEVLRRCVVLNQQLNRRNPEAVALNNLGYLCVHLGRLSEAWTHYQTALVIHRDPASPGDEESTLINLADLCLRMGLYDEAMEYIDQVEILQGLGRIGTQCSRLITRARAHLSLGRPESALRCAEEAHGLAAESADPRYASLSQVYIGTARRLLGELDAADAAYRRALDLAPPDQLPEVHTEALNGLALLRQQQGRLDDALQRANEALTIASKRSWPLLVAHSQVTLAALHINRGNTDQAEQCARKALALAEKSGERPIATLAQNILDRTAAAPPRPG